MTTTRTHRKPTPAELVSTESRRELLETKIRIRRARADYARGARKAEELAALATLEAELAAL